MNAQDLCEFEVEVLASLAGAAPPQPWGAALGAALGFLKGRKLVSCTNGLYEITDAGRAELKRRGTVVLQPVVRCGGGR